MKDKADSNVLYHIAEALDWEKSQADVYVPSGYESEGFIHLSLAEQVPGTYKRYYTGKSNLMLLTIQISSANKAHLKFEDFTGRGEEFPHLYRPLQKSDIVSISEIPKDSEAALGFLKRVMAS
ncbi:MAG: DUF952 domain-containing protein [Balneolia bacterium]|nr:DUF952 domain-containing protein [Balneolia bacterium]